MYYKMLIILGKNCIRNTDASVEWIADLSIIFKCKICGLNNDQGLRQNGKPYDLLMGYINVHADTALHFPLAC